MALAYSHLKFMFELRKAGVFKSRVKIMEFGEQNWFGDVDVKEIMNAAKIFRKDDEAFLRNVESRLIQISDHFNNGTPDQKNMTLFRLAELYYEVLFDIEKHHAIDLHGTAKSVKNDLNLPLKIKEKYDLSINFGTGEHVFNQYMFFKNLHDVTENGGFMLHSMPNQGCYDHGFFNYHPTFLFDLAHFNNYKVVSVVYADLVKKPSVMVNINRAVYVQMAVEGKLSPYSALFACLQKTNDNEFIIPQQGYYGEHLPENLREAWSKLER